MKSTHTFATLEVSRETYDEIEKKLKAVGYDHAFVDDAIDMHGIGLVAIPSRFRVGQVIITGSLGPMSREGHYFEFEGRQFCVTENSVDVPAFVVTEPVTGLRVPETGGATISETADSLAASLPLLNEKAVVNGFETFFAFLDDTIRRHLIGEKVGNRS